MKKIVYINIVMLVGIVCYLLGRQSRAQAYEAACKMSDVIRCYQDHIDTTDTEFNHICNNLLDDVELTEYVWGY